jgi:hypothetical protein
MSVQLDQVLSSFQALEDSRGENEFLLQGAWYVRRDGCLEKVILQLGDVFLMVVAKVDDTIAISAPMDTFDSVTAENVLMKKPWSNLAGNRFGWGWATVNQQGYCDGIMLSFSGILPQISMTIRQT